MSRVVDHLAELTGYRDRDALDVNLAAAVKDLLNPELVAIYRVVGEPGQQHWLTRARLGSGDVAPEADPIWAELHTLPPLHAHPTRAACLSQGQPILGSGAGALSCFPLDGEQHTMGVLELLTREPLSEADQRLVAGMLRVYRNFQGLLDYSERDTLTGLLNRKTFDESFLQLAHDDAATLPAAARGGARRPGARPGAWLAVIDIDHFKRVNDQFGHLIGDEVLLLLARLLRSTFRFHDKVYRFGGEEFVALVRCGDLPEAQAAFERLRINVASHAFPQVGSITVSVGFTRIRAGDTPNEAFERADQAVYYAKQNGRNRVAEHATLVEAGSLAATQRDSDVELF
ncbi:MAG TPA: GGDEF domain-containing protein [Rubrivivax sp.]|nr:GGDEF domain-containing protein [Rubrivivax sp.]